MQRADHCSARNRSLRTSVACGGRVGSAGTLSHNRSLLCCQQGYCNPLLHNTQAVPGCAAACPSGPESASTGLSAYISTEQLLTASCSCRRYPRRQAVGRRKVVHTHTIRAGLGMAVMAAWQHALISSKGRSYAQAQCAPVCRTRGPQTCEAYTAQSVLRPTGQQ